METNNSIRKMIKIFVLLIIFGIAMGFLESAIVFYLREIYYKNGFSFPLSTTFFEKILVVDLVREFCTIVMLVVVGILAGKNFLQRFCYFLFTFAIWDIFYYVGLKVVLNWPTSLLTWDLLFLIPIPWIGPVLAPIIASLTMITLALVVISLQEKGYSVKIKFSEWGLIILGAMVILYTFMLDYSRLIIQGGFLSDFFNLGTNQRFLKIVSEYIPINYNWLLFGIGESLIISALFLIYRSTKSSSTLRE